MLKNNTYSGIIMICYPYTKEVQVGSSIFRIINLKGKIIGKVTILGGDVRGAIDYLDNHI